MYEMLHNGELHALYRSPGLLRGSVQEDIVGSAVTRKYEEKWENNIKRSYGSSRLCGSGEDGTGSEFGPMDSSNILGAEPNRKLVCTIMY
jgi:hypothetical protein